MGQVSKNSIGGAAGAQGACGGGEPPQGCGRDGPALRLCHEFKARPSLLLSCCRSRRNKGNKGAICPQHPGSVGSGDRGPQHWARTACAYRRRLWLVGGGEAHAVSFVFLHEHHEHHEHHEQEGTARRCPRSAWRRAPWPFVLGAGSRLWRGEARSETGFGEARFGFLEPTSCRVPSPRCLPEKSSWEPLTQLCVFVFNVTKETRGRNKEKNEVSTKIQTDFKNVCVHGERGSTPLAQPAGPPPAPPDAHAPPTPGAEGQAGFSMRGWAAPSGCQEWCQHAK